MKNESFTNRQIAFILFGIIVGYGIMGLPKNITEVAGTGGWFSLCIATGVAIIFTYIITYLGYVHQNKTICEYSEQLVGKGISIIIIIIYIVYFFTFFTMVTRMACETIRLTILIKTPIWALVFIFLLAIYYAIVKGLGTLVRLCEIYGMMIIVFAIILHTAIFTQGELIHLQPVFILSEFPAYIKAVPTTILPFLGMEVLTVIPFHRKKNDKRVFKYTIFMIGFIGFLYILIVESCVSVMGADLIIHYKDALLATIRRIDIQSLQFLRRLDALFLLAWIMAVFCTLLLSAYGTVFLVSQCCKKIPFSTTAFIIIFISFIVSLMPKTIKEIEMILKYIDYGVLLTAGIIPSILFVLTKVKKYDQKMD